ncbi:hypothetical protein WN944_004747 [Citrus x changshan-huyou]|uniref:Uncharacterized protein n=1 Tax=Citrus x changshan-huyou TaxID=2935761 RepID=A0AAP0M4J3_9ROSI
MATYIKRELFYVLLSVGVAEEILKRSICCGGEDQRSGCYLATSVAPKSILLGTRVSTEPISSSIDLVKSRSTPPNATRRTRSISSASHRNVALVANVAGTCP